MDFCEGRENGQVILKQWDVQFFCELKIAGFNQNGTILEDNGGDAAHSIIDFPYILLPFLILFDINPFERDAVLGEKTFCAAAISAPICTIYD
jgi:hypothetical protein